MTGELVIAAIALVCLAFVLRVGRGDLTHPAVAFGSIWFTFVAAAQLRVTDFEHPWSARFAAVVLVGGAAFVAAAFLVTGSSPTRGSVVVAPGDYSGRRLVLAAGILFLSGVAGIAWKASIVGGVPLLSADIDVLRARAYGEGGDILVPAPSTFLTNGFHLGCWCLLAAAWCGWADSRLRRALLFGGLLIGILGAFSGGSRNALLFTLAVPLVAAYQLRPRLTRRAVASLVAVVALALLMASAVFLVRVHQREAGRETFLDREVNSFPLPGRVVFPIYVGGVFPLEAERRLIEADRFSRALGSSSLQGLPDAFFPRGKLPYVDVLRSLTYTTTSESPDWVVATYQGRAFVDLGIPGVVLVSVVLGLLFGGTYRACRGRHGLFPLAVLGYCAYYAAFLFYDNLLSLAMMGVGYDLLVLSAVDLLARQRARAAELAPSYGTTT